MNKIHSFDVTSGIVTCQAGCILETLDNHVQQHGHVVPLDLGAKGSCHIGGNLATNAGGLRLLRYGSLHGTVVGLEVVLANGQVLDMLSTLRKDNTGYDLKHLFLGSEGTLGVITQVALLCPPKPSSVKVAYLACSTFEAATGALMLAREKLGEILSAFEFFDKTSLELTKKHLAGGIKDPLPGSNSPFYLVVETSGSNETHDAEKLDDFLTAAVDMGAIDDGVAAQDQAQAAAIWKIREGIPEALRHRGAVYKYDISIPVSRMYDIVNDVRHRLHAARHAVRSDLTIYDHGDRDKIEGHDCLKSNAKVVDVTDDSDSVHVVGYGHLGDGNLHLNVSCARYDSAIEELLEPWVYEWTAKHKGSISAEHGLGVMKASAIGYSKSKEVVDVMRHVKHLFDSHGILNPYKVLPYQ